MRKESHNAARKQNNDATLQTAFSHGQLWEADEEAIIMEHNYIGGTLEAAYALGRTYEAVEHRRALIQLRIQQGKAAPHPAASKPLTLDKAVEERTKQIAAGLVAPTIMQIPGGYKIVPGKFTKEEV